MAKVISISKILTFLFFAFLMIPACSQGQEKEEEEANIPYANVFESLDGTWAGLFYVYTDTLGQRAGHVQPTKIDKALLDSLPLKVSSVIDVVHIYESDNPYYQRGLIIDKYLNSDGDTLTVESDAINKVENGKLFCIVNKPDEQVVHDGSIDEENFIIWQRNIPSPLKIEYFKEKAEGEEYSIIGWGYYGDDDPTLSPKTWFYGSYLKQD